MSTPADYYDLTRVRPEVLAALDKINEMGPAFAARAKGVDDDASSPTENYKDLADAGIPHYAGADSFVRNGAFATCGVNYTALGTQTADLAYQAITEGMDGMEDYYTAEGGIVTVNTETAEALNIDTAVFSQIMQNISAFRKTEPYTGYTICF